MTDRFAACLAETLRWEGGYSNHPADPGGATMRGVIQRVYDGYRDGAGLPRQPVRLIQESELQAIYRRSYWNLVQAGQLRPGIDLAVFDFCVNSGASQAIKSLQRVLGVKIDGNIGAVTMAAIDRREPGELIRAYLEERRRFYRALRTFPTFGKGWLRRADGIEAAALEMAGPVTLENVATVVSAPAPLPNAAEQAQSQGKAAPETPKPPWITELSLSITGTASKVVGLSAAFGKWSAKPAASFHEVVLFFLAEPLVIAGAVTVFCALTTFLWRRRVRAAA